MAEIILFDRDKNEQVIIKNKLSDSVARLSDDYLKLDGFSMSSELRKHLEKAPCMDLSMLEVVADEDIDMIRDVREYDDKADMMLMADGRMSPMKYMTPDIRACSLLLKPFDEEELEKVIHEFIASYYRKNESDDDEAIVIENREGRTVVALSQIYYIEAREKKVFFRLKNREYSKYDTLDNIRKLLPDNFIQSHRSYLFNSKYLDKVKLSENAIYLEDGIFVPLSRSFKASIKEYLSGISGK
jgi:DNA-binding LytR/AlgR family response regulator